MSERETIYTSHLYHIDVVWDGDFVSSGAYAVINTETGVREMETTVYPQARLYLKQLEEHLKELDADAGQAEVPRTVKPRLIN